MQLYLHQRHGSASRPVRELKGFERISLDAGETRTARFTLGPAELRYWNAAARDWVQDATTFDVWVGGSSAAELGTTFRSPADCIRHSSRLLAHQLERVVGLAGAVGIDDPRKTERFEPSRVLDIAEVDHGPTELASNALTTCLAWSSLPAMNMSGSPPLKEGLIITSATTMLNALTTNAVGTSRWHAPRGSRLCRRKAGASGGEVKRVTGVDEHLGVEAVETGRLEHVLGRTASDREDDHVAEARRFGECSCRGGGSGVLQPRVKLCRVS